jgi:hypothetical protein
MIKIAIVMANGMTSAPAAEPTRESERPMLPAASAISAWRGARQQQGQDGCGRQDEGASRWQQQQARQQEHRERPAQTGRRIVHAPAGHGHGGRAGRRACGRDGGRHGGERGQRERAADRDQVQPGAGGPDRPVERADRARDVADQPAGQEASADDAEHPSRQPEDQRFQQHGGQQFPGRAAQAAQLAQQGAPARERELRHVEDQEGADQHRQESQRQQVAAEGLGQAVGPLAPALGALQALARLQRDRRLVGVACEDQVEAQHGLTEPQQLLRRGDVAQRQPLAAERVEVGRQLVDRQLEQATRPARRQRLAGADLQSLQRGRSQQREAGLDHQPLEQAAQLLGPLALGRSLGGRRQEIAGEQGVDAQQAQGAGTARRLGQDQRRLDHGLGGAHAGLGQKVGQARRGQRLDAGDLVRGAAGQQRVADAEALQCGLAGQPDGHHHGHPGGDAQQGHGRLQAVPPSVGEQHRQRRQQSSGHRLSPRPDARRAA